MALVPHRNSVHTREVWAHNLDQEFALIRTIVDRYPFIAMDTEFPGVVLEAVGNFPNLSANSYQKMRHNVDLLKLVQLGLTFCDRQGNLPSFGTNSNLIWQFNFREFDPDEDPSADDSIKLLKNSGIDFVRNRADGVSAFRFVELLMSSGVVLNREVTWIVFHGGYDVGYLIKILTCKKMPETKEGFYALVSVFFPVLYDVKHMIKYVGGLHGGLDRLAGALRVDRVGFAHQAGSDSLLTSCLFRRVKERYFKGGVEQFCGVLFGLDVE